ncbi:MAG: carboxypeptidase-like regulatory domain-containing protein [Cyclobacteriaceae bacterium]
MKKISYSLIILLLSLQFMFNRCTRCTPNQVCFSGKVVDTDGKPVAGAILEFGGSKSKPTETQKDGSFRICPGKSDRFVLNVTKLGFGFVSKIYTDTSSNIIITMEKATVKENLNPTDDIVMTDTQPNTASPVSPDVSRLSSPLDTIPFVYDAAGNLIAFGAPPEIVQTYEAVENFQPQQVGATVTVEPDALEDPTADKEQQGALLQAKGKLGPVTGSVSTVDVYSPDGMPGDYTTRMNNEERGYMITYGAVDVNFYSNGKPLQLKKGKFATLSIPVDTLALIYGEKLPRTIPLLVYDKEKGIWRRDGNNVGTLNKAGTAYEAKVSHFSVFNMDEEFDAGEAVCYKICSFDARPAGSYPNGARIQITGDIPGHVKDLPFGSTQCSGDGGCTGGEAFAINNMKPNTPIGVRLFNGNTSQIVSSYVFITGNAGINAIDCSNPVNYAGCGGPVNVSWGTTPAYMNADGTMNKPIIAIEKVGTNLKISWVYISGPPPGYMNPGTAYHIEWSHDNFATIQGTFSLPAGNTALHNFQDIATTFTTDDGSKAHKFRIRVGPTLTAIYSDAAPRCYTPDTDQFQPC